MEKSAYRVLRPFLTALALVCALHFSLYAQAAWDASPTKDAVRGITNVAASIAADSFVPMTHYRAGQWTVTGVPAWFQVDRPFDDPKIEGDDLAGWAGALGGGYALNDRLMAYGILSMLTMEGGVKGNLYGDLAGEVKADTEYALLSFNTGIGYDLVPGEGRLSVPVYGGVFVQRYDAAVELPSASYGPGNLQVSAEGDGILFGVSLGIAASYDVLSFLRITPYFLYSRSLNKPEMKAIVKGTLPFPYSYKETIEMDPVNASMVGFCLTFISTKRFSLSISAGGLLSSSSGFYNDAFLDGLRMKSVVLAVSYRSGEEQ